MPRLVRYLLAGLIVLALAATAGYAALLQLEVLPRLAFAPGFSMVDHEGRSLTSEDLRGAVVLYTFTYARADDPRRATGPVMRAVQERLPAEETGDVPVRLVTVSFDPGHDTPEVLRREAEAARADTALWRFATAPSDHLRHVLGAGFGVYYEPRPDGGFAFDPTFVLVDGQGIVRSHYRLGLPSAERLTRDLMSVVREAQAATGARRAAYEAAHLFSCYSVVDV